MDTIEIVQIILTIILSGILFVGGYMLGVTRQSQKVVKMIDLQIVSLSPKKTKGEPAKRANKVKNSKQK